MTVINLETLATVLGGSAVIDGHLMCTQWGGRGPVHRTVGDQVIVPEPIDLDIVAGVPSETFELEPTDGTFCWRVLLTIPAAGYLVKRYVTVPGSGPVDWEDLVDVDPATFTPSETVVAAWEAAIAEVQAIADSIDGGGGGGAVDSVNGRTGVVVLAKADVGLSAVDNTADADKPVSTAAATALGGKAATVHTHAIADTTGLQSALDGKQAAGSYAAATHSHTTSDVTGLDAALTGKASSAHTHAQSDVTGLAATLAGKSDTGHTHAIADSTGLQAALDGKQAAGSYAAATHSHAISDTTGLQTALDGKQAAGSYAATVHTHAQSDVTNLVTDLGAKAPLASPGLTGTPTAPTAATATNTTQIATTAFVKAQGYAPLASPAFTGTPTGITKSHVGLGNVDNTSDASKPVSTAQQAAIDSVRGLYVGINAQTGTTYAPVLTDQGKLVTCSNAAAITVTLPSNATTAFPIGTQVDFLVLGAGMVTFVAGASATTNGTPSLVTRAQYSAVTLIKVSTNGWVAVGDLA